MKVKMTAHYCRAKVFTKDDQENFYPAGEKWIKVRANAAIPASHKMFK